jgi:hypothetical protein
MNDGDHTAAHVLAGLLHFLACNTSAAEDEFTTVYVAQASGRLYHSVPHNSLNRVFNFAFFRGGLCM